MPKKRQCAALPFKEEAGETWILLITSRDTGRWILPKGWAEKRRSDSEQAATEAYEEAGIVGEISHFPIYRYHYAKRLAHSDVACAVDVFPLRVTSLLTDWPEARQRRREWFTVGQAALMIDDGELVTMLLSIGAPNAISELMLSKAKLVA